MKIYINSSLGNLEVDAETGKILDVELFEDDNFDDISHFDVEVFKSWNLIEHDALDILLSAYWTKDGDYIPVEWDYMRAVEWEFPVPLLTKLKEVYDKRMEEEGMEEDFDLSWIALDTF